MSVINQMLRDLDKQRQQQYQSARSHKASKPQRLRLWVLLCGAMVLAVMAYWLGMHHAPVLATTAIQPTVDPSIAKPSVAEASTAKLAESPLTETTSVKPESAEPELAISQTGQQLKQSESTAAVPEDDTAISLAQNSASSSASTSASIRQALRQAMRDPNQPAKLLHNPYQNQLKPACSKSQLMTL